MKARAVRAIEVLGAARTIGIGKVIGSVRSFRALRAVRSVVNVIGPLGPVRAMGPVRAKIAMGTARSFTGRRRSD